MEFEHFAQPPEDKNGSLPDMPNAVPAEAVHESTVLPKPAVPRNCQVEMEDQATNRNHRMNYEETIQYYPTPRPLASYIMSKFPTSRGFESVLEPSAGKGNLIEAFKERFTYGCRTKFYACEISGELRHILASKKVPILGEDFLTADLSGHYFDAIMMNPPFRNGVDHLLKAWEVLAGGGRVVCVLNSQSIDAPSLFGNDQVLLKLIADNESEVSYHSGSFAAAENKTNVRVAVVVLDKPKAVEDFSHIFEGLDEDDGEMGDGCYQANETGLIAFDRIKTLVDRYKRSLAAHAALSKAHSDMMFLLPVSLGEAMTPQCPDYTSFALEVRKKCWHKVFAETKLANYMTGKMKEEFDAFIVTQGHLEFTVKNIDNLLSNMISQIGMIRTKAVEQIFDKFTQYYDENRCHKEGWKTNQKWHANKKIILPYMCEPDWGDAGTVSIVHRGSELANDIEKAMCLLTGKKFEEVTAAWNKGERFGGASIYQVLRKVEPGTWYETEFFNVKIFKKGTMHLVFKTDELWRDFNTTACEGKNWIGG